MLAEDSGAGGPGGARYDLFVTDGHLRLRLKLEDAGVGPMPDRLYFMLDGKWQHRAYRDIAAVTLSSSAIGSSAVIGMCRIRFRDGTEVLVSSAGASGLSDGSRDEAFAGFVREFHRRLVDSGAAGAMAFHSGFSTARARGLTAALVAAGVLLVALPLGLFIATGNLQLLYGAAAVAFVLIAPALRVLGPNRPASYRPSEPPTLLA